MAKPRVLLTDYAWPDLTVEQELLSAAGLELVATPRPADGSYPTPGLLAELAADADGILTCWAPVPRPVLVAARNCRVVSRLGIGLDNIDVEAATELGMLVTNVPDYCLHEVAEQTFSLLFSLARKIAYFHSETKAGRYRLQSGLPLRRISGQTLGLIGLGNIGQAVAQRAQGMGLRVLAYRKDPSRTVPGVTLVSLEELLTASDYVSLHVPLTPETRGLLNRARLALMKPTAYLINTSRGGLIDHAALAEALASGKLAGAGLDVQDPEPPDLSLPPWNDPRVIVTPHAAFCSQESLAELRLRATAQVVDVLAGRCPPHPINPQVWDRAARPRTQL